MAIFLEEKMLCISAASGLNAFSWSLRHTPAEGVCSVGSTRLNNPSSLSRSIEVEEVEFTLADRTKKGENVAKEAA